MIEDQIIPAIELRDRWRAHDNDEGAGVNTILAVFGLSSPLGRYALYFVNAPYVMWLEDKGYDLGWCQASEHADGRA
jgi:hypothetical protein